MAAKIVIKLIKLVVIATLAFPLNATTAIPGQKMYPFNLLQSDEYFTHHIIVAEKSSHKLYLFANEKGMPKLAKVYPMATGKKVGNKSLQGDHRTPEGVYFLIDFLSHKTLIEKHGKEGEQYGVGAFVLNYPNKIDKLLGKTGHGIWLHSTNDETRINKGLDSRGCIIINNSQLIDIAKYIELNRTALIIVHDFAWLGETAWKRDRSIINNILTSWAKAWSEEKWDDYIKHYSQDFHDNTRGNLNKFKQYKRAVFNNPGTPSVKISSINILRSQDYAVATFKQHYTSSTIQDVGKKTLYFKKDEFYNWKIVAEQWSKAGIAESSSNEKFKPSMRFF